MAAYKSFRSLGVMVVSFPEEQDKFPSVIHEMNQQLAQKTGGQLKLPILYVTDAKMTKPIATIPMERLLKDARKAAREVRNKLKEIEAGGGGAEEEEEEENIPEPASDPDEKEAGAKPVEPKESEPELLLPSQQWENAEGKKITAAVVRVDGDKVIFRLANGKTVPYEIAKLSKDSQEKIELFTDE